MASGRREQRHIEAAQPVITGAFCQDVAGGAPSSPDPDEKQFQRARWECWSQRPGVDGSDDSWRARRDEAEQAEVGKER